MRLTLLLNVMLLCISSSFSQNLSTTNEQINYKRVIINGINNNLINRLHNQGVDLTCGASFANNQLQIELNNFQLDQLSAEGINYTVLIDDLETYYSRRAEEDLPRARAELKQMQQSVTAQRTFSLNEVINNVGQHEDCDEIDWAVPLNFNLNPNSSPNSFGGCLTFDMVLQELDDMRALYPNLISVRTNASSVGQTTIEGRTVYYVRISDNPDIDEPDEPETLYQSLIHSRESATVMNQLFFMWYILENYDSDPAIRSLVNNQALYFIPVFNPDGFVYNQTRRPDGGGLQRKNRNISNGSGCGEFLSGVDLNRNSAYYWGNGGASTNPCSDTYLGSAPFSENETQIMRDFFLNHDFELALNHHSFKNAMLHAYAGTTIANPRPDEYSKYNHDMTEYNRYAHGPSTSISALNSGNMNDWMLGGPSGVSANGTPTGTGSGKQTLAWTPENGSSAEAGPTGSGFWPAPSNFVPIAKRAMRMNFLAAYFSGKYAKLHDFNQSDFTSLTGNLNFAVENLGQKSSVFTVIVTPVSSNIISVGGPSVQSGMSILQQNNVDISYTLDPNIQPNDVIEYQVTLTNDYASDNILYQTNIKKIYSPSVLLADNPDVTGLGNWTTSGGTWSVTSDAFSGSAAITSTASGSYNNSENKQIRLTNAVDLSNSETSIIQFYTKWDLERSFDYVQLEASIDGSSWTPLCGKLTKPGAPNINNTYSGKSTTNNNFQPDNQPLYDGDTQDRWNMEEVVIDASNNSFLLGQSNVFFRFDFRTDSSNRQDSYTNVNFEGFTFDDFKITSIEVPCDESNPPSNIAASNITSTSTTISWDDIPSTTYDLRYREVGTLAFTEITDVLINTFNITSLNSATDYEVQVRTRCASTTSDYSVLLGFVTVTPVACTGTSVSSFPYAESFENGLGLWGQAVNGIDDSIDWVLNTGGTPSANTGPSAASEGAQYLFTEASTNVTPAGNPNMLALLESPCFELNGFENASLEFDYHMFGSEIGSLDIEISVDDGATYTNIFSISGQQQISNGAAWITEVIDLSQFDGQTIKLRFSAVTGTSFRSDIAIDNIRLNANLGNDTQVPTIPSNLTANNITQTAIDLTWDAATDNGGIAEYLVLQEGVIIASVTDISYQVVNLIANTSYNFSVIAIDTSGNQSSESNVVNITTLELGACTGPSVSIFPYSESFEGGLGLWTQSTLDNIDWTQISGSTPSVTSGPTGPLSASVGSQYLYTESSGNGIGFPNRQAILNSPCFDLSGRQNVQLAFDYHMFGAAMGDLTLEVSTDNGVTYTAISNTLITTNNVTPGANPISGQQQNTNGEAWRTQIADLSQFDGQTIRLRFFAITGNSFTSDIAIDNIIINADEIINDTEAPSIPTNVIASNITQTTIDLSWNASSDNVGVVDYDIIQDEIVIGTTGTTNFQVTGLVGSTSYAFEVLARDAAGNESANSNTVNVTTLDPPDTMAPSAPTNLVASNTTEITTDLSWNASMDNVGVVSYDVLQDGVVISTITTTTYQVTGLVASTSYAFEVLARDAADNISANSNAVNVTTIDITTPTTPSNLTASNTTETTTNLSWLASTDNVGIAEYDVFQDAIIIATVTSTNYQVIGLTASTSYAFNVRARDAAGNESTDSNTANITTLDPPDTQAPSTPTNLTANNITETTVDLSWTASTDNIGVMGYDVLQDGIVITSVSGTLFQVTGLTAGTSYMFNVRARDVAGNMSANSNAVNATTLIPPDIIAPMITLNGLSVIDLNVGEAYVELGAMSTDNIDGDLTGSINTTGIVDTSIAGVYTVTYSVSDAAGNSASVGRTVNVNADTTAPAITLNGASVVDLNVGEAYVELGATAIDNLDGDITLSINISGTVNIAIAGVYTVIYSVSDAAGNSTSVGRTVNVNADTTAPVITLNGASVIDLNVGEAYVELGATATDNIDGNLTSSIVITGSVNTSVAGSYILNYNVSDTAGNAAVTVTRTVNVNELTNGCSGGISNFPYNEGFESGIGTWAQSTTDDINWTRDANGTPSNGTGPTLAIEGSFYMYVEASGNGEGFPNRQAIFNSPCFDLSSLIEATFSFQYHMFGSNDFGSIDLEISDDNGQTWTSIWNRTGNQGDQWLTENIDLTPYVGGGVQLRFNRVTGGIWQADFAFDNVSLIEGAPAPPQACSGGIDTFPYAESFENTLGAWSQGTNDDIDWTIDANGTPSSGTGPSFANDGSFYVYVEASGNGVGFPNIQAILNSPCFDLTNETSATFDFDYHMFGSNDFGSIALQASNDNGQSWVTLWSLIGNQGDQWFSQSIDLSAYIGNSVQLRFNRITGGIWQADFALDNLNLNTNAGARNLETKDIIITRDEVFSNNKLNIYPNPVKGSIIKVNSTLELLDYDIYNALGQKVSVGKLTTNEIKVQALEAGVYFIRFYTEEQTMIRRFIKE